MKKFFLFLRPLIALFLLFILFYKIGFNNVLQSFSNASLFYIPFIIFLWVLLFLLSTYNLNILLSTLKVKVHFLRLFKYYMLSWSSGLFLPGKFGELVLIRFFKKENLEPGQGLAVYILDKFLTLFVAFVLSFLGILIFLNTGLSFTYLMVFASLLSLLIFLMLIHLGKALTKHFLKKYSSFFEDLSQTLFNLLKSHKTALFKNLLITFVKAFIQTLAVFLLFLSFNVTPPILKMLLLDSMVMLVSFIPITISGLGLKEYSAVIVYETFLSLDPLLVASAYLLGTILTYLVGSLSLIFIKMEDYL